MVVDENVQVADLVAAAKRGAGDLARSVYVFDIYRGDAIDSGRKSVALGLILQETSRTLTDQDADESISGVVALLEREYNAKIRV
jgi:phenylalanyl-tRNA synthetase beta chain